MPLFVVDRVFSPPITTADASAASERLHPCLDERDIKHITTYLSHDGTRGFCVFEASDAERVREANRTANVPFERVWPANEYRS
jgi:hypothetical protein